MDPVVEGKSFVVTYQLYNIGDSSANKIEVTDRYDPNRCDPLLPQKMW